MKIINRIKYFFKKNTLTIFPLPEHVSAGKPVDIKKDSVLLFFYCEKPEEIKEIENLYIYSKKIFSNVDVVVFFNTEEGISEYENSEIFMTSINDFNIFGKLKERLKNWLSKHSYDITLCFFKANCLVCNSMISSIESGLKVGAYDSSNVSLFDLTISQKSHCFDDQLELYIFYLNNLNINK